MAAAEVGVAHQGLLAIAHCLDPAPLAAGEPPRAGAQVRQAVEACLDELVAAAATGQIATWLHPAVEHLVTVLRRLGDGLYHCYDVPDLPRTDNGLEQFYRRVKASERRITGHRRSDSFVVRVGGCAVFAAAASGEPEAVILRQVAGVAAAAWQAERATLRAAQERQVTMRRFRLHRDAFLADIEARWSALTGSP